MSADHPSIERLSELVDGDLDAQLRAAVERHVAGCVACADTLGRLRRLVERAAALPPRVEPRPELWPAVRNQLRTRPTGPVARAARWTTGWGLRAAAAILLVAGSSAVTMLVLRGREPSPVVVTPPRAAATSAATPAAVVAVDRSYAAVVDELTSTLRLQRGRLDPSTVAVLERTLRVIDDAIAEARAALAADPGNEALLDVLSANYEQKVQLLRRASELPARS